MTPITTPTRAAQAVLGLPSDVSGHGLKSFLRYSLQTRHLLPFTMYKAVYTANGPVAALVQLSNWFPGVSMIRRLDNEYGEFEFEGFHREANPQLFLGRSVDFEDRLDTITQEAEALSNDILAAGGEYCEARSVKPQTEPCSIIVSGSILDFHHLNRAFADGGHPVAQEIARSFWAACKLAAPEVAEVIEEVQP